MTQVTITNKQNNEIITEGILGQDIEIVEGYYYFDPSKVDLSGLTIKKAAYFCPVKNSKCDYYFVSDATGNPVGREIAWVYPEISNNLFSSIAGKIGFYSKSSEQVQFSTNEIN